MDKELLKRLQTLENTVNGNAASIIALQAVLASAPEIGRVEKGRVAKMLDALVADAPALELLRRRAGNVANDLIDNAGEAAGKSP